MGLAGRGCSIFAASVAIGALTACGPLAQDAGEPGGATLLQRLVLGTGQAKVATDTPQAVTVIEQQDIDRKQATTIGEILDRVPNVQAAGARCGFAFRSPAVAVWPASRSPPVQATLPSTALLWTTSAGPPPFLPRPPARKDGS